MERYSSGFSRSPSNPKVIQNEHFLSKKTPKHQNQMNLTESDLIERPDNTYPRKTLQNKVLEEDYAPASFDRALQYRLTRSYCIKQ